MTDAIPFCCKVARETGYVLNAQTALAELEQLKADLEASQCKCSFAPNSDPGMVFDDDLGWLHKAQMAEVADLRAEVEKWKACYEAKDAGREDCRRRCNELVAENAALKKLVDDLRTACRIEQNRRLNMIRG